MIKEVVVWQCPVCEDVCLSNNWDEKIVYCKCQKTFVKLADKSVHFLGSLPSECKANRLDLKDLLL